MPSPKADDRPFDPLIFWGSASVTVLYVLRSIILPQSMERVINTVFTWTTEGWGWLYLWTAFALVIACLVLMLTKFGDMKLGHRAWRRGRRAGRHGQPSSHSDGFHRNDFSVDVAVAGLALWDVQRAYPLRRESRLNDDCSCAHSPPTLARDIRMSETLV